MKSPAAPPKEKSFARSARGRGEFFVLRHENQRFTFHCRQYMDAFPIDPDLPKNFEQTPNESRPARHMAWWGVPFITTWTEDGPRWLAAWPSGTRYDVRCLDGGAWDRSTCWGQANTLEEALKIARTGPAWRRAVAA